MRKVSALYSTLIESISNICDNVERMEAFWTELDSNEREVFDSLSEAILVEKQKIARCKRDSEIYSGYDELERLLRDFDEYFSDYPEFSFSRLNYIIVISKKIFENSSVIPDEDINLSLTCSTVSLGFEGLAYITNLQDLDKTVIWMNPTSVESLRKLVELNADINCWYSLLCETLSINFETSSEYLFYCKSHFDSGVSPENVSALLKIHMASAGLKTLPSRIYSYPPSNSSIEEYCPSQSYIQFLDVIGILGEYNNRTDILSKYLSIYHVIENFMFKEPIVRLERSASGSMFSIRDFRRLYKSVDINEQDALKKLFRGAFEIPFGTVSFGVFAFQKWSDFLNTHAASTAEINEFLALLSLGDSGSTKNVDFHNYLSRMVYQIRCSIVHNKETEFHISSESYPEGCRLLVENYLLTILEEMVFLLMSKDNPLVWYTSSTLSLWYEGNA